MKRAQAKRKAKLHKLWKYGTLRALTPATKSPEQAPPAHLDRRFGLLQATALNMSNMVGIGPFITIPLLMSAMSGPQAMLGWVIAALIAGADGMIWSELGAALPGSGGSYVYLREGFGRQTFGRLMAFLFIWQFILSGPLEIATGYIGFIQYTGYFWPAMTVTQKNLLATVMGLVVIALVYRQNRAVARITIWMWVGTLLTTGIVIVAGLFHFNPKLAFDFPPDAFHFSLGFLLGLGAASRLGVYDYLGYYDICYLGDEVRNPGRVIPRSIIFSIAGVAAIYFVMNLSIIGVVPWREFVPAAGNPKANFVVSIFMEKLYGPKVASIFTLLVLWTTLGSVFALLLGYSRIPYAAAREGYFFRVFARLHGKKNFPYVSVLVLGGLSIVCSFFELGVVIDVLIITRILVQFIGQIAAVVLLRKRAPELQRPYKIWLYPVPCIVALAGWLFIFFTERPDMIRLALGSALFGALMFLAWSWWTKRWPFVTATANDERNG